MVVTNVSKLVYLELEDLYASNITLLYNKEQINVVHSKKQYLKSLKIVFLHIWLISILDYITVVTYSLDPVTKVIDTEKEWKELFGYTKVKQSLAKLNIQLDPILTNLNIPI